MARRALTKVGSFEADSVNAINDNFTELYAAGTSALISNTPGVATASKIAPLDANKAMDAVRTAALLIGVSGAEVDKTNVTIGVAAGYKVARGEHTQAAASDTVVTGLTTVVAVVIAPRTRTVKQLFFNASIGDQAGTPAAGSILITSQKPTAVNDVTPTAATDFTDNIKVNWVAIGT